jgi:hypothetical protein
VLYSPHRNAPSTQQLLGLRFLRQERHSVLPRACALSAWRSTAAPAIATAHPSFLFLCMVFMSEWFCCLPVMIFTCTHQVLSKMLVSSFVISDCVKFLAGDSRYSSWVTGPKDSRLSSSNHFFTVISQTRPPGIQWNDCEDINYFSIWFLSSISYMVLPTLIYVSAAVTNSVPRANSFAITMQSWPSYKRGTSDQFWDVGWVLSRNFIGSHSPPLVAFSGPSKSL